jgi:type III restriction enzyme
MQFRFDPNQEHQVEAIESVADLLDGMARSELDLNFALGFGAVPNRLDVDEAALLANLRAGQERRSITPDDALACIEEKIATGNGERDVRFPNFSVEMETGTGKTYVYIRTALELSRRYGLRKFIIVVPSIAIREGVIKTLKVTEAHLRELYDNAPCRYYVYDSNNLSQVRQFALSNGVELMIMTIDSFNKASNVIRQSTDRLQGEMPINLVQAARPVLILDEPQNMESEQSVRALSALDPLFALRYSATHRNPYNLVYRLTPFDAYRQGLVKRIEVASVVTEDSIGQPFIRLDAIKSAKKSLTAKLTVHKLMARGNVKEASITVKPGDSLEAKTGRTEYAGCVVDEINWGDGLVRFANNIEITEGESKGADKEALFAAQIQYTIEEHMRRQARLREHGIKVLSLFFIDRVDNYAARDGVIRRLFDDSFNTAKKAHGEYAAMQPGQVREAYFAKKRRKGGETEEIDTTTGKSKEDEAAFDLIMKDKERLLSFEEPVSFVFSHSALREGWDNPNIFQICTLNQTASEIKKRQEVGRGVRLAVNQDGERVHDDQINVLTVVANESYERYVDQLQSEIEAEYGADGLPPKPANARRRKTATLRKHYTLKPEFKELWERIKHKTRYAVKIDGEALLGDVMPDLDAAQIKPPRVTITKARVSLDSDNNFEPLRMSAAKTIIDLAGRFPLPNLVDLMANLMEHTTPPVRLTRATLLEVYRRTKNKQAAIDNPQEFASTAVRILKAKLADHLVNGIEYTKIGAWYEMSQLVDFDSWQDYLVPAKRSVYNHVLCDSKVEREFVEGLEKDDRVKLYLKLPMWFSVTTPVGDYSPDWAIVMEERDEHGERTDTLYLVRETKGANLEALRPDEQRKIKCGKSHFEGALGVSYRVISGASDLP